MFCKELAINAANGILYGLDDDDFFEPDRLLSFISNWKEDEDVFLYTDIKLKEIKPALLKNMMLLIGIIFLLANIIGNQIFSKKEYFGILNGFDENLPA